MKYKNFQTWLDEHTIWNNVTEEPKNHSAIRSLWDDLTNLQYAAHKLIGDAKKLNNEEIRDLAVQLTISISTTIQRIKNRANGN